MVADQFGDALPPDFSANVLQSIPVQAGGLYPISDVWYIDPGLDTPDRLRIHIAQFAREIAAEGVQVVVRLQPDQLNALDGWISKQDAPLTRPEALRAMLSTVLKAKGK